METMAPTTLDEVLHLEVRKQDGSEYDPDSLKGCIGHQSRTATDERLWQAKNRAQPYNSAEEESFWSSGLLGDHNGVALTNANYKNLSEHFGFRGRQDHYDAYVQDFEVRGSRLREEKWRNACDLTRTQRRLELVA
ncbi:hypothetical protein ACROYT_G021845 [Oculina patagonica]